MALTEFEQAILNRLKQLSPEERKIQSETNVKKMGQNQLSPEERRIADQRKQLSPEERKIQRESNLKKMGQKQIDARNAKAQAYLDKKAAQKAPSAAYKAGRSSAKAQQAVKEGAKQLLKETKALASSPATKAAGKMVGAAGRAVAPVVEGVRAARLLTSEDYRKQNEEAYEDLGEKNAFLRAVEGGLGGVSTIYAAGKNMLDTVGASARGRKSGIAAEDKKRELIARGILDEEGRPIRRQEAMAEPTEGATESTQQSTTMDGEALSKALVEAPDVQPAETAPRTAEVEAAYKEIEAGNVPKAIPVDEETLEPIKPQLDEGRMAALFRTTTGTSFNPKSKADMGRMQQLRDFVGKDPEMLNKSNSKIALDFYRTL
jgi:hypothetical protein